MTDERLNLEEKTGTKTNKWGGRLFDFLDFGDTPLFIMYSTFLVISALFISSADTRSTYSIAYLVHILFALSACVLLIQVPSRWFADQKTFFRATFILFLIGIWTLGFGQELNGAKRWISLGIISIQPSEFLKILIIIIGALAGVERKLIQQRGGRCWSWNGVILVRNVCRKPDDSLRKYFGRFTIDNHWFNLMNVYWILCFILLGIFAFQNLSMLAIYIPLMWLYPFLFDLDKKTIKEYIWKQMKLGGALLIAGSLVLAFLLNTNFLEQDTKEVLYKKSMGRIPTALSRLKNISDSDKIDYKHLEQRDFGVIALCRRPTGMPAPGSSLLRGKLAQSESDYILSFIVEEYSVFALFVIFALYAGFIGRMLFLVRKYSDENFPLMRYLFHGFVLMLLIELIIHLIVNANIAVTGQSLPFISKGGTSLLAHSILLGILLNICSFAKEKKAELREQELKSAE